MQKSKPTKLNIIASSHMSSRIKISLDDSIEGFKLISRIWHGWTTPTNADLYEALLKKEIFQDIQKRNIAGYQGIDLLRRDIGDEVEFITIMWFDSFDAVQSFAGEDYEIAVVPDRAKAILSRFDARSQHYQVKERLNN